MPICNCPICGHLFNATRANGKYCPTCRQGKALALYCRRYQARRKDREPERLPVRREVVRNA